MRIIKPFNDWMYKDSFCEKDIQKRDLEGFENVTLPHTNREIPFNYFDETETMFISCYRKIFQPDIAWKGKRVFLRFGAVSSVAEVFLNGKKLCEHKGGYTAFAVELTENLVYEEENVITVKVDSTERNDVPPFGYLIDYLCYGGMYREVDLIVSDSTYVNVMHITPLNVMDEKKKVEVTLFVNALKVECGVPFKVELLDGEHIIAYCETVVDICEGDSKLQLSLEEVQGCTLWEPDSPQLYNVRATLGDTVVMERFGFRKIEFTSTGFLLNDKKMKLVGLNRHQSYPYVGYAMPKRAQEKDADILKNEIGINIVRTSHYPQSKHFLDKCDELGLLVFEEIPGWQYIGDEQWKQLSINNVEDMIMEGYNHPSIVLWGVRINESQNDYEFYQRTNAKAHEMDSTRPTGGVKYIERADFQEDVYVMNEFQAGKYDRRHRDQNISTGLNHDVPFLVSEFTGAFHPTKRWDDTKHREEQALRHAWAHDEIALDDRICGAIGWCAFDYNTHYQFGPGDRVCYHGVADMFRIPKKWTTAVYESQKNPKEEPVLVPATLWVNGDIDECGFLPMYIFSNCDYVEFYFGDKFTRRLFPYKRWFAGLKHAPMYMDRIPEGIWDEWGWEDATFIGYVDGEPVITKKFAKNPIPSKLKAKSDDTVLIAKKKEEPYDVTRIVFEAVDQYENSLDYMMDSIQIFVEGPAKLIGPDTTTMQGGCIAAWIRTTGEKGTVKISARTSKLQSEEIEIKVQ